MRTFIGLIALAFAVVLIISGANGSVQNLASSLWGWTSSKKSGSGSGSSGGVTVTIPGMGSVTSGGTLNADGAGPNGPAGQAAAAAAAKQASRAVRI